MNIVSLGAGVVITAILSATLKKYVPQYCVIINISASCIILLSILSCALPAVYQIKDIISYSKMPPEYAQVLFKSLGICFVAQFACDSCKDAGENSLASKIEFGGKIAVLITALPLFEKIIQTALNLMGVR